MQRKSPLKIHRRLNRNAGTHDYYVHPTAEIAPGARIGSGTKIWQHAQVREGAVVGEGCILGKDVYVDAKVTIGHRVKVQNGVSIYHGVTLEDGVFCGPHCVFTNDKVPRAITPDGTLKQDGDWAVSPTLVKSGASIGAHATVVCGTTIGRWALVGAGAVVTHDVPDYGLVYGNPARLHGFICPCGGLYCRDNLFRRSACEIAMWCPKCSSRIFIPDRDFALLLVQR